LKWFYFYGILHILRGIISEKLKCFSSKVDGYRNLFYYIVSSACCTIDEKTRASRALFSCRLPEREWILAWPAILFILL